MKKMSLFYKIYFSVIAVFLVLLTVGLCFLGSVLSVYENAQPMGYMEGIVAKHLQKGDLYGAVKEYGITLSEYESEKDVNAAFKAFVDGEKLTVSSSGKKLEGYSEVYNVKAGDDTVLTFYLKKAKKGGFYGIKGYEVGIAEFDKDMYKHYQVHVPSDVKLIINGVEVKKSDRVDLALPEILSEKIGDKQVVTHQTVKLKNMLSNKLEIKAYAADGSEVEVIENNGVFTVGQVIESTEVNAIKNHAIDASQGYAKFMQEDAPLGSISHFFDTKTEFYQYVRKTELWVWKHTDYNFEDVTFGEVHKYSENLYSCRVTFTHILTLGNKVYKDYFDKYVYIEKTANGLKVIDMQTPTDK